tara:strand:+ start:463 stop:1113 length:651 start_codon:yes stop_codon:yes gene_type:complete
MTRNLKDRINTSLILLFLIFLILNYKFIMVYSLIILGAISLIEFFLISKRITKNQFYLSILNFSFSLYIFFFCLMFFFFNEIIELKFLITALLLTCIASDIGGFVFGNLFKGPKLTYISPKKTITGSIGSLILSSITLSFLFYYFLSKLDIGIILLGIITSISCQLGDLFFSFLKRKAKLKDTGNIFPGHGGVLDRLDGIFLGIPLGLITLIYLYK